MNNTKKNTITLYFSFAKHLSNLYEYHDNTNKGDLYRELSTGNILTKQELFYKWIKYYE